MASNIEYEAILKEMLSSIPQDIDKREGSIIYNALAPTALQLAEQNYMLVYMFNLLFADTAEGDWLDRVTNDFGVDREQATYALRQIDATNESEEPFTLPIGSRFAINNLTFKVTQKIETGKYKAQCEQLGTIGNLYSGIILPIDNISGLGIATLLPEPLIPACDNETDDSLRERFYIYVRQSPYGGNIADYERKTLEIEGVGAVKVFNAVTMRPGHVGLIIGDDQENKATQEIIDRVQLKMGLNGDGIAPIGHTVTVKTSTDFVVNVAAQIRLKSGTSLALVMPTVQETITAYISSIRFKEEIVFYAKLVANILNCHDSIIDVGVVAMNGAAQNIALEKTYESYQIPAIGTITITEVV